MTQFSELDRQAVNALRVLAIDQVEEARSGHPGMPLGVAPIAYVLWSRFLRHDPHDPAWPGRDRFVLSAGHGSALLYSLLHLFGYDLSLDDLKRFRQWGSPTPGHPEYGLTPGVEVTTGPLGQGLATGVGMALAERHLAERFNRNGFPVIGNRTFVLASDGDLQEGISHEAASLAGHWKLGRLVVFWDDNHVTIDGPTSLAWSEDVAARFAANGWRVLHVDDGNDLDAVAETLERAVADESRPVLIRVRTTIGFGAPTKAGSAAAHGAPLGADEAAATREALGWPVSAAFLVPERIRAHFAALAEERRKGHVDWQRLWEAYEREFSLEAADLKRRWRRELPKDWEASFPGFDDISALATRAASGRVLNALAPTVQELIGGSADLSESNNVLLKQESVMAAGTYSGRTIHFGIREHAMAGIANGLALNGGLRPFVATFLIFSDYLRPALRLAALMKQPVIYVFTHDSLGVGEDGPTHQPVEQLASLRLIPGVAVIRPADAREVAGAWQVALARTNGPTVLVLSRQKLPVLDPPPSDGVSRGAYIRRDAACGGPEVVIMATGSEVATSLEAQERLEEDGIATRVVSAPCLELFAEQPVDYQRHILGPAHVLRVAVEAGRGESWGRWTGNGEKVCLERFGASAPGDEVLARLGFSPAALVAKIKAAIAARRPAHLAWEMPRPVRGVAEKAVESLQDRAALERLLSRDASLFGAGHADGVARRLGWLDLPGRGRNLLPQLHRLTAELAADGIDTLVLLGMGGSSLAPEVLQQVGGSPSGRRLVVLDTTDPDRVGGVLARLDPRTAVVLAVSKSGTTVETSTLLEVFWHHFLTRLGNRAGRHFLALTEPGTVLASLAGERSFRQVLNHPVDVGGRFAALSAVGLFPAVWLGQDADLLLAGGERALSRPDAAHTAVRLAGLLAAAADGRRGILGWSAPPTLAPAFDWLEQLVAESTGKSGKGIIPVPLAELQADGKLWPGTVVLSPRQPGEPAEKLDRALDSALAAGHPVARLSLAHDSLGEFFMLLELTTALTGFLLGVNPFDEPDVLRAKELAREALATPAAGAPEPVSDPVAHIRQHLRNMDTGETAVLLAYVPENAANAEALKRLTEQMARETGAPVTAAFGPRYLHSTGQLHKGGPAGLRAVVLTADPLHDLPIPGQGHTLGQLRFAQAMGDVAALRQAGRKVSHLHVGRALTDLLDTLGGRS